jgi:hypothetical protein
MTATITPPAGAPELVRTDPVLRLADYDAALSFYLMLLGQGLDRILFVENSNSDVSTLAARCAQTGHGDQVEFISFYGLDYPPEYGRGYGEMRLLDHAMDHSRLLKELGRQVVVWKMTGRYVCRNLLKMFRTSPAQFDLYCDLKDRPMPWMDLRLFGFTRQGHEQLLRGTYTRLARSELRAAPEKEMRRHIGQRLADHAIVPRFRTEPIIEGIRGNDGRNYARGKNLAKYVLRAAARKVTPFLWI